MSAQFHPEGDLLRRAPGPVDFDAVACQAISLGIFTHFTRAAQPNDPPHIQEWYPHSLLSIPYKFEVSPYNLGAFIIEGDAQDFPEEVMHATEQDIRMADDILLPQDA